MQTSPAARPHPLAPYADRIDPDEHYTAREIADLLGITPNSISGMATYGLLPGSKLRSHARGGRQHTWTGKQLLRLARLPLRVQYDHERFSPATLYRAGCRCPECIEDHGAESTEWRRTRADEAFTPEQRERVVDLVADQTPVAEAAAMVGVTPYVVYARATWDGEFAAALDEAAWSLCVLGEAHPKCSTASGYRGSSRATDPTPPCRGTGCREWRRGASRQERTAAE